MRWLSPGVDPVERKAKLAEMFKTFKESGDIGLRDELIESHLYLVEHLARRFRNRGEPLEDLVEVGVIGLIKAIDRFDPYREIQFTTFATPTIVGELKRHFRDQLWSIRVPRRLQELDLKVNHAIESLTQRLERSPTIDEIAAYLQVTSEEVIEGLESSKAYIPISLDSSSSSDPDKEVSLLEFMGHEDPSLVTLDDRAALSDAVARLSTQEKRLLYLRFVKDLTQSEIAAQLGISQMHVSRLLRRTLQTLRETMLADFQEE